VRTPSGSVTRCGNRWKARIRWTDDSGRRTEKSEKVATKNGGNDLLTKWRQELRDTGSIADRRGDAAASVTTIEQLARFYRERYAIPAVYAGEKKISGMRAWKTVRGHVAWIEDLLGGRPLRAINYGELHDLRDDMLKRKTFRGTLCSIAYANRVMSTLRRMLHVARQRGWMQHNPFDQGDPLVNPALEAERDRTATPEEEALLLKHCSSEKKRSHLRLAVIIAIESGMRQAEILRLTTRPDLPLGNLIDLKDRVFRVAALNSKALQRRIVPMTRRCEREIRAYLKAVPDSWGTIFGDIESIDTAFRGAREDAKIVDLMFHDLRHTFITRALARGIPEPIIQKIVGHRPGTKTTRRYTNVDVQLARSVAESLDRAIARSTSARRKVRQRTSRQPGSARTAAARR
jgi:integrase